MEGFFSAIVWVYVIGAIGSIYIYSARATGLHAAAMGHMMLEWRSFFRGYLWTLATFVNAVAWPVVLILWLLAGKPPPPTLFGPAAAEAMGMPPELHQGLATKFVVRPRFRLFALVSQGNPNGSEPESELNSE